MPSFDVIVPCYNYGRFLRQAAASVLSQEVDLRLLIIDDASQDESNEVGQELARQDPRVTFRRHAVNAGHIDTYNEGIDWVRGDYCTILSADDLLMPGALPRAAAAFATSPEMVMVYGRALEFSDGVPVETLLDGTALAQPAPINPGNGRVALQRQGTPIRLLESQLQAVEPISATAAFYRRNSLRCDVHTCGAITRSLVQKRLGGYRKDLPHSGDFEMWLRLAAHGPVGYIPFFQGASRAHDTNMSRQYYSDLSADILQRAHALDVIEQSCGTILPSGLLTEMRHGLAIAAVRAAGVPFFGGDSSHCDRLLSLAKRMDPTISRSLVWNLFSVKRALGPAVWNKVPPSLRALALKVLRLA